jgi:hypothetical protein
MTAPPTDSDATRYVSTVLTLYLGLPETPLRPSAQDRRCAREFYDRNVPLPVIESAFLLASLRRLLRPADLPPLSPIRSLAYFQPVIAELLSNPAPDNYLDYCATNSTASPAARTSLTDPLRQMFRKLRFQMIANTNQPRRIWPLPSLDQPRKPAVSRL